MARASAKTPVPAAPTTKDQTAREKRKVVRRDPEKRRQQNLQAQKKYRDKLRKRLDDLEILAASIAETGQTAVDEAVQSRAASLPVTPVSDASSPPEAALGEYWTAPRFAIQHEEYVSSTTLSHSSALPLTTVTCDTESDLPIWDPTTCLDPSCFTMTNQALPIAEKHQWYKSYVDCGCAVRHVEVHTRDSGSAVSVQLLRVGEGLPSPKANNLRINMLCNIAAVWEICLMMGLSEATICEEDGQSFFYRPHPRFTDADERASDSVVRTVRSIYSSLKPDLRPTKEQITIPHHPMLDVLPFPTLRSNFLKSQALVDDDELFHDILNGLICWGGAGLGRKDRDTSTGKASSGTPWESRSWEAKPWFLRKYWALLGGDDGELVRQSEWWRGIRGDDQDIWTDDSEQPPDLSAYLAMCPSSPPELCVSPCEVR